MNTPGVTTFHVLTSSEIAALLPGDSTGNLDIILRSREGDGQELKRINTCHRSYDSLLYILIFPTGCDGWHLGLNRIDNRKLTAADFYKSRLQIHHEDFNIFFKGKKLTELYAVDQWAKVEAGRLDWVRRNKKALRVEKYQGLLDAVQAGDVNEIGVKVILPSTIYGSPRFYSEAFQDAMAIVRHLGKPDIFITFTCNSKWSLNPQEQACDRPDLSCRIFKQKFDALMDDILKSKILGSVTSSYCYSRIPEKGSTTCPYPSHHGY
ncbi:ATP-dependent DNA helicase PIF1 [Elysia marginata]|uniref:ATP-dependent DNA helicase PIF1 n=1 Tax=Elysia marginata TaxID=1093978 RepID=A0AAV4FEZ7_9GAST|nr:ATP-dependent DNA helicase PIF1 [Elysia marginata]